MIGSCKKRAEIQKKKEEEEERRRRIYSRNKRELCSTVLYSVLSHFVYYNNIDAGFRSNMKPQFKLNVLLKSRNQNLIINSVTLASERSKCLYTHYIFIYTNAYTSHVCLGVCCVCAMCMFNVKVNRDDFIDRMHEKTAERITLRKRIRKKNTNRIESKRNKTSKQINWNLV